MRATLTLCILLLSSLLSYAQEGTLYGKVTNESGDPLVNATIIYRGDITLGTTTDFEGNYTLNLPIGERRVICRFTNMISDTLTATIIENQFSEHNFTLKSHFSHQSLNEVEIRVGKFDRHPEEITVSLEVIKPGLIENKNTRNVEAILDQTPGLNIMDGEAQIRGGSGFTFGVGSKVAVIVDDMPLLSGDAGRPEWNFVPLENIHQIEVEKGAGSVLSGSAALSGSIHFRTKYPTKKPLTKASLYTGIYSYPKEEHQIWQDGRRSLIAGANFLHAQKAGNWDLTFGANVNYDEGYAGPPIQDEYIEQTYPDTISNFTNQQMRAKRARVNFNVRRYAKKVQGLSYGINGNAMINETPMVLAWLNDTSGLYQGYPGATFLQKQHIFNIDPFIEFEMKSGVKHKLRGRYLYNDNDITANQSNHSKVYYGDYQFMRSYKKLLGIEFIGGITSTYTDSYAEMYAGSGKPNNQLLNVSGYGQIEKRAWQILNISLGGRLEYFELNRSETALKPIFRAGGNIKLYQETYLRMSYGQGYRFPTITERYIQTGVGHFGVFPNPELQPETSSNSEIGIKQGVKIGKIFGYIDLAGFWQEYNNTIEYLFGFWDTSQPLGAGFKFLNTGKSQVVGIDASFSGMVDLNIDDNITFMFGYNYVLPKTLNPEYIYAVDEHPVSPKEYTYLNTSINPNNNILKYRSLHNIKSDIEWNFHNFLSLGLTMKYFSKMENLDGVIEEFENSTHVVSTIQDIRYMDYFRANNKGKFIFDLRGNYSFNKHHKISLVLNNFLNKSYSLRPLKIEAPRSIVLQYTLTI